jgi:hypothetical protein
VHEVVPELQIGCEADISMTLQAPETTGRYVSYFRMETADETKFGQRLYANIQVSDEESDWQLVRSAPSSDASQESAAKESQECGGQDEKAADHSDTFYACQDVAAKTRKLDEDAFAPVVRESEIVDDVNDSLEASMTLPRLETPLQLLSSESPPSDSATTADSSTFTPQEYSEFAAEITMIDSATEAAAAAKEEIAEDLPVVSPEAQLWHKELSLLNEMGFSDVDALIPLLQQHVGTPMSPNQVEGMQRLVASLLGMV